MPALHAGSRRLADAQEYPAGYPGVIAVGSTDERDELSDFSNYGSWISIVAPGSDILSTLPTRVSRWMKMDLPSKLTGLGLPVTTVNAKERSAAPA